MRVDSELLQKDCKPEIPYRPIGQALEWAGRKIVLLEKTDFATTKPTTFSQKASFVIRSILSLPGAFMRLLAGLDKPLFQIDSPKHSQPIKQASSKAEFSVLTLNAACLPSWITVNFNQLRPTETRAQEIADTIIKNSEQFDVICLQEVFSEEAIKIFRKTLSPTYGWSVHHAGRPYIGFDSGLCIFSKFPIRAADFQKYSALVGEDALTNKGFLCADLDVQGQKVRVYTTHTQAGGYPNFLKKPWLLGPTSMRRRPHFEAFRKHIKTAPTERVIVTGDLNLNLLDEKEKEENGKRFFALFQPYHPRGADGTALTKDYLQSHQVSKHMHQPEEMPLPTQGKVIDAALVVNSSSLRARDVQIVDHFTNSSDHLGVAIQIVENQ